MGYKINSIFVGNQKVRPPVPPVPKCLCFTANTAGSTVKLNQNGSPTAVTLETSTDGATWTIYTIGDTITLSNIGDKVYRRNTSTTDTGFSLSSTSNLYIFSTTGSLAASGDVMYLLNKNGTDTASNYCFSRLFYGTRITTAPQISAKSVGVYSCYQMFETCTMLTTAPSLPATTIAESCYEDMFYGCTALTTLPELPATGNLPNSCYYAMFRDCSNIKLSSSQTSFYTTPYRIPPTGTASIPYSNSVRYMFKSTGGDYTSDPNANTTYYTSNTIV